MKKKTLIDDLDIDERYNQEFSNERKYYKHEILDLLRENGYEDTAVYELINDTL